MVIASPPAKRRKCVISFGALMEKAKPPGTMDDQRS